MIDVLSIIVALGVLAALIIIFLQMTGNWEKVIEALRSLIKALEGHE